VRAIVNCFADARASARVLFAHTGPLGLDRASSTHENERSFCQQLAVAASRPFAARLAESLLISRDCEQIQKHKLSKQMII